jgi:aryl-alcohol dehydrogenase-like predicted oxidoreductase
MEYRQLGSSTPRVSEVALGSWLTYSGGVARDRSVACIDRALGLGINLIDTANVYGRCAAETLLGEMLRGRSRDSYVLATKVYFPMSDGDRGLSRGQILKQLENSLRRLQTDHVDLYQCHRFDKATPLDETMTVLTEVVRQGKACYIGFSEWPADKIRAALAMTGVEPFVSSQPQYSLLWRAPETEIMPLCAANGISQVVWSPLAQGVLTGKYQPGASPPADARAGNAQMGAMFRRDWLEPPILEAVQRLKPIVREAGLTLAQFALAWVLRQPNVAAAIVGATRPEQVVENAAASGVKVDPSLFTRAEEMLRPHVAR